MHDSFKSIHHYIHFMNGTRSESNLFFFNLSCTLSNVQCMVADSFEVCESVEILCYGPIEICRHLSSSKLCQVCTDSVFIFIDDTLDSLNFFKASVCISVSKKREGVKNILLSKLSHLVDGDSCVFNGKRWIRDKSFFKPLDVIKLFVLLLCLVFDDCRYKFLQH